MNWKKFWEQVAYNWDSKYVINRWCSLCCISSIKSKDKIQSVFSTDCAKSKCLTRAYLMQNTTTVNKKFMFEFIIVRCQEKDVCTMDATIFEKKQHISNMAIQLHYQPANIFTKIVSPNAVAICNMGEGKWDKKHPLFTSWHTNAAYDYKTEMLLDRIATILTSTLGWKSLDSSCNQRSNSMTLSHECQSKNDIKV